MAYGGYASNNPRDVDDFFDVPDTAQGAAVAVAVMIVGCALFLTVLKRSGFRAMVAVGRG